LENPKTEEFLQRFTELVGILVPEYAREGKTGLSIGIGCTGGQHRSVAVSIEMAKRLKAKGIKARYRHRELTRTGS